MTHQPVPIIDLDAAETHFEGLDLLDAACRDHGFFILSNHGIGPEIEAMWEASRNFFAQSRDAKRRVARTQSMPLGYYDRELTKRKRDLKEVFDYMRPSADEKNLNQWPEDNAFKATLSSFFESASEIADRVLKLVFLALEKNHDGTQPLGDPRTSTVRLNYYPTQDPLETAARAEVQPLGDMALHHHTDPGILTLLLQDETGGLQTLTKEQGWVDVPPREDSIVVNLGDILQVWSNDQYRAAIHRVTARSKEARFSTPYFYNPAANAVIHPREASTHDQPHYHSFTWREYIKGRVDDNFADLGVDDIQIDRFRRSA
jgi:isopenicillin N synthase-like dioxygenase